MKILLENDFVLHYRKQLGIIGIIPKVVCGTTKFFDPVACRQCPDFFRINCPHETFVMDSATEVNVIEHENAINKLQLSGEKCDLMLYDNNKIVLLDMTCTMEHYLGLHRRDGITVEGKRMKSRNQLAKSIERLCEVPSIETRFSAMASRNAILGYRVKDESLFENVPRQIARSEHVWLALTRQHEHRQLTTPMPNGFVFKMVRYPNRYQW